jgi:hypothetical protein
LDLGFFSPDKDADVSLYVTESGGQTANGNLAVGVDLKPFVESGMNFKEFEELLQQSGLGYSLIANIHGSGMVDFSGSFTTFDANGTEKEAFNNFLYAQKRNIKYNITTDSFQLKVDSVCSIEWARNIDTNKKDLLFILKPDMFISAGTNPENVSGWTYEKFHGKTAFVKTVDFS